MLKYDTKLIAHIKNLTSSCQFVIPKNMNRQLSFKLFLYKWRNIIFCHKSRLSNDCDLIDHPKQVHFTSKRLNNSSMKFITFKTFISWWHFGKITFFSLYKNPYLLKIKRTRGTLYNHFGKRDIMKCFCEALHVQYIYWKCQLSLIGKRS